MRTLLAMTLLRANLEDKVGSCSSSPFGDLGRLLTLPFTFITTVRESVHFVIIYIMDPIK